MYFIQITPLYSQTYHKIKIVTKGKENRIG